MTQKQFYESPSAELLVVRFEENIMSTAGVASNSANSGYENFEDLGEI